MDKLISTLVGVVVAVGVSAALFIGANKWFDQSRSNWRRFGALTGAVLGGLIAAVLVGNRIVAWKPTGEDGADLTYWLVLVGALSGAGIAWLLAKTQEPKHRLAIGAGGGLIEGAIAGVFLRSDTFPAMRIVPLLVAPVLGAAVWVGVAALRRRRLLPGALTGAATGWLLGSFGIPTLGSGTRAEALMGTMVLGLLVGLRLGVAKPAKEVERNALYERSRAAIFLGPSLAFIGIALVIPAIRTIYLSFLDRRGREAVGFTNYQAIFTDPNAVNLTKWSGILTSSLTRWALLFAVVGIVTGIWKGRKTGRSFEASGMSFAPIAAAIFLGAFAMFAYLRGTLFNNLWWVFTVTLIATGLGLAVAVLADRSSFESAAKSIIFMPMAISFVGASIIWRFIYIARPPQKDQTGVLNGLWVWLGKVSNTPTGSAVGAVLLALLAAAFLFVAYRAYRAKAGALALGSLLSAAPILWLIYRFLGPGLGGFVKAPNGEVTPDIIIFTQEPPFNNLWLMVVLIWIQTGFAMVIFSAAIKAVPSDLIEAAKVDGATESQTFWRVVVPQIAPTIGVVVTTLIVVVMKVFDIVKVMTNGNFDTQVIANLMWTKAFGEFNIGLGSALAVVLFVSVLPVMYINVRRMQKEAAR